MTTPPLAPDGGTDADDLPAWRQQLMFRELDRKLFDQLRAQAPEPTTVNELHSTIETDVTSRTVHNRLEALLDAGAPIRSKELGRPHAGAERRAPLVRIWWYEGGGEVTPCPDDPIDE